jgi:tetratricopeptide (TPR) repeat protein
MPIYHDPSTNDEKPAPEEGANAIASISTAQNTERVAAPLTTLQPVPEGEYKDDFDLRMTRQGWRFETKPVYNDPNVIKQLPPHMDKTYNPQEFFRHFGDNTFRKLLSTIFSDLGTIDQLKRICSNEKKLYEYLTFMREQKIAVEENNKWSRSTQYKNIEGIGPTLEWYVAECFRSTLKASARHGVTIEGVADGGDLDVVAFVDEKLVMVECKSGKPANITENQLHLFLRRAADLHPTIALFLMDTESDVDKQIEMLKEVYLESDIVGPRSSKQWDTNCVHVRNVKKSTVEKALIATMYSHSSKDYTDRPLVGLSSPSTQIDSKFASIFQVPYRKNHVFTGREEILSRIHTQLQVDQPLAISGLGGIGKTQIAIEYAHQYCQKYQAVLWTLADTRESLVSGYVTLARVLNLPEKSEQDQIKVVQSVIHWLATHTQWLLILDNADDLGTVREFLPTTSGGHLLLTTQAHTMDKLAIPIRVESMSQDVGTLFLLRRASILAPDSSLDQAKPADKVEAEAIVKELGGLPLAIDQAGAFIQETDRSLSEYLKLYETHRKDLLARLSKLQRAGHPASEHPASAVATVLLSFQNVERANPTAADLLRLYAFLAPEAIPEEIVTSGVAELAPMLQTLANPFALLEAIAELGNYSLVKRDQSEKLLSVHRVVQAVIKDEMDKATQQQWAARAVRVINHSFPYDEVAPWLSSQQYLPHALVCTDFFSQQYEVFAEVAELLHKVGIYLLNREQFKEAESYFLRALDIREQFLGTNHPDTAQTLNHLGILYGDQGEYEQAASFYQRALEIREQVLGANHPDTANSFNNLATRYRDQGKHQLAELYFLRALAIKEQVLGANHPDVANTCNNLALLYYKQEQYDKAWALFQRALTIREKEYGPDHPYTAQTFKGLANLYRDQGKYEQAESLYKRALTIVEQNVGRDHSDVAAILNSWATHYSQQGKYEQADPLYQRALAIQEQQLRADHPRMAQVLGNVATFYYDQGKYEQAEPLYQRALNIREQAEVADKYTAITLQNLARLYSNQGKYEQAEPLYKRALEIYKRELGPKHSSTVRTQEELDHLLQHMQLEKRRL